MKVNYLIHSDTKNARIVLAINEKPVFSVPVSSGDYDRNLWETWFSQGLGKFSSSWVHVHGDYIWGEVDMDKNLEAQDKIWGSLTVSLIDQNKTMMKITAGISRGADPATEADIQLRGVLETCRKVCQSFVLDNFKTQINMD